MISRFMARSVASITASLTSMVKQLENHAEAKLAAALAHDLKIANIAALRDDAQAEVTKAKAAAAKIASLFS